MADFLIPLQVTMCISWFWSCHGRIVNSLTTCISWFRLGLVMADFSIPLQHIFDGLGLVMTCHSRLFHSLTTHISWFRSCQFPHNTVANKGRERDSWNTGGCNRHHCLGQCHDWCRKTLVNSFATQLGTLQELQMLPLWLDHVVIGGKSGHTLWKWKWGVCVTHVFQNQ